LLALEALEHPPPKTPTNGDDKRSGTRRDVRAPHPITGHLRTDLEGTHHLAVLHRHRKPIGGVEKVEKVAIVETVETTVLSGTVVTIVRGHPPLGAQRVTIPQAWATAGVTRDIIAVTVPHRPGRIDHVTTIDGTQADHSG